MTPERAPETVWKGRLRSHPQPSADQITLEMVMQCVSEGSDLSYNPEEVPDDADNDNDNEDDDSEEDDSDEDASDEDDIIVNIDCAPEEEGSPNRKKPRRVIVVSPRLGEPDAHVP
jgi:hypothetical protein